MTPTMIGILAVGSLLLALIWSIAYYKRDDDCLPLGVRHEAINKFVENLKSEDTE